MSNLIDRIISSCKKSCKSPNYTFFHKSFPNFYIDSLIKSQAESAVNSVVYMLLSTILKQLEAEQGHLLSNTRHAYFGAHSRSMETGMFQEFLGSSYNDISSNLQQNFNLELQQANEFLNGLVGIVLSNSYAFKEGDVESYDTITIDSLKEALSKLKASEQSNSNLFTGIVQLYSKN